MMMAPVDVNASVVAPVCVRLQGFVSCLSFITPCISTELLQIHSALRDKKIWQNLHLGAALHTSKALSFSYINMQAADEAGEEAVPDHSDHTEHREVNLPM